MKEGRLLESQKIKVNELIAGQGFEPGQFKWVGVPSVLSDNVVIDKVKGPDDRPFFFKFDRDDEGRFWAIYSPGLDERESRRMAHEWNNYQFVRDWLSAVMREMAHKEIAVADSLTGELDEYGLFQKAVFNRDLPTQAAASENSGAPLALIMIDLDHLNRINKSYGHPGGDQALKLVAESLKQITGTKGSCYKYGGDEFSILLPNYSADEAATLGERIRKQIEASTVGGQKFRITVSIGVASAPEHAKTGDELLAKADAALNEAKDLRRNVVRISGEIRPAADSSLTTRRQPDLNQLREAEVERIRAEYFQGRNVVCPRDGSNLRITEFQNDETVTPDLDVSCPNCGISERILPSGRR